MSIVFTPDFKFFNNTSKSNTACDDKGLYFEGSNGRTILFIHGMTGTPNEMKFLATYFNRKGYTVICPRLANHGGSIRVLSRSRWQDFYESVRKLFIEGPLKKTNDPVFVSGLSMGALLALLAADEFSDRVCGVSCLAPTLFYDGWNAPSIKYLLPIVYSTFIKYCYYFKEEPPYGVKNEAIRQRIHKYYNNARLDDNNGVAQYGYPFFPVALLQQLQLLAKYLEERLPNICVPVQLIQAKDDDMASVKNSKFIYDRVGSEVKEMILLYDSYHVITADHERGVVAEKMECFIEALPAAKK